MFNQLFGYCILPFSILKIKLCILPFSILKTKLCLFIFSHHLWLSRMTFLLSLTNQLAQYYQLQIFVLVTLKIKLDSGYFAINSILPFEAILPQDICY